MWYVILCNPIWSCVLHIFRTELRHYVAIWRASLVFSFMVVSRFAWFLCERKMSGRSLKSRNKITVGHLVKKLECSISVVKKSAGQVCDFCFATLESRKRCSRCQKLFYCSRSCQLNDWKFHQQECPFLSQINETIPGFVRLLGKCSYSWHQEKNAKTTNDIDFSALYEDVENVTENEKLRYAEMMTLLKQFLGSKTFDMYFETPISCMKLINQVVRNTTTICSEELDEIGYGL